MFEGEYQSLNAINSVVPTLCPKGLGQGQLQGQKGYWLATEFLELGGRSHSSAKGSGMSLPVKLAKLHSTTAPIPEGFDKAMFGFPVSTCCGDTPQRNTFESDWGEFFGKHRLLMILERCEKNNGVDKELRRSIERTVSEVVPRLLRKVHLGGSAGIQPVVCHGDLWSGNKGRGSFIGRTDETNAIEDVIFDPSAVYGHNEYDHGIMNMFGGFSGGFFKEYFEHIEKTEPKDEYSDRVKLYEAYHHLNHYAIFGGGYKGGAVGLLNGLLKKYGTGGKV